MVKFSDIEDAFFFVSSDSYGIHTPILDKVTWRIYHRSEMSDWDEIDKDALDWENCIDIPHKNELDLGHKLVFAFVRRSGSGVKRTR